MTTSPMLPTEMTLKHIATQSPPSKWDWLERSAKVFAAVAIPIVLGIVGYYVQLKLQNGQISRDYVQLSVTTLQRPGSTQAMRAWAIDLINHYSEVGIQDPLKQELLSGEANLPSSLAQQVEALGAANKAFVTLMEVYHQQVRVLMDRHFATSHETLQREFSQWLGVNTVDGHLVSTDDSNNPILDADGRTIPMKRDELERALATRSEVETAIEKDRERWRLLDASIAASILQFRQMTEDSDGIFRALEKALENTWRETGETLNRNGADRENTESP